MSAMQSRLAAPAAGALLAAVALVTTCAASARPLPPKTDTSRAAHPLAVGSPGTVAFNNPLGDHEQQYALVDEANRAIEQTPPGATIRLAEYSFAMPSTATALIAAHDRGVAVQVVVDDHSARWHSVRRLLSALGKDTAATSFVKVCHGSCRGGRGNQHAKFVTFSRTGDRRDVSMVGSLNFTNFNARVQWNDLYTTSDPTLFAQLADLFALMSLDQPQPLLRLPSAGDGLQAAVSPVPGPPSRSDDPVAQRLAKVRCTGATAGAGTADGHTIVRVAMHAWNGPRGIRLAHQVGGLERDGCDVRVLYGIGMGRRVAHILRATGVPTRDSGHDGRFVHEKVMVLSGVIGDATDAEYVWTGSHNWSDRSLRNDELILRVEGRRIVAAYLHNFHRMWALTRPPRG
jgi:phosphatidylserine/phosphatidylglycerophosphate/cardiolipin synthase-like enzyme